MSLSFRSPSAFRVLVDESLRNSHNSCYNANVMRVATFYILCQKVVNVFLF